MVEVKVTIQAESNDLSNEELKKALLTYVHGNGLETDILDFLEDEFDMDYTIKVIGE